MREFVRSKLESVRRDVLDVWRSDPLLDTRLHEERGGELVGLSIAEAYHVLVERLDSLSFQAVPSLQRHLAVDAGAASVLEHPRPAAPRANMLQAPYPAAELHRRLLYTLQEADAFTEEYGAHVLYLALGWLCADEITAEDAAGIRRAPLLLVPVELYRNGIRDPFRLRLPGGDVIDNPLLRAVLAETVDVTLPPWPGGEAPDIEAYLAAVTEAVHAHPGLRVERTPLYLGCFVPQALYLHSDLPEHAAAAEAMLRAHPVLRALLNDGFTAESIPDAATAVSDTEEDNRLGLVVEADEAQRRALRAVARGGPVVLDSPPGTGRTQVLVNLIADAVRAGRHVLFVSQKQAALDSIRRRLDQVGLGAVGLSLYGSHAGRQAVSHALRHTLALDEPVVPDREVQAASRADLQARLDAYSAAIHTAVDPSGVTPYEAYGTLLQLVERLKGASPPSPLNEPLSAWPAEAFAHRFGLVRELEGVLRRTGPPRSHPFWGSTLERLTDQDITDIARLSTAAREALLGVQASAELLATLLSLPVPSDSLAVIHLLRTARHVLDVPDLEYIQVRHKAWHTRTDELIRVRKAGKKLQELHQLHDVDLLPEAWDADVNHIRNALLSYGPRPTRLLSGEYRRARRALGDLLVGDLPDTLDKQLALVHAIQEAQRLHSVLQEHQDLFEELFGIRWQGIETDWAYVRTATLWLSDLYRKIHQGIVQEEILKYLGGRPNGYQLRVKSKQAADAFNAYLKAMRAAIERVKMADALHLKDQFFSRIPFDTQHALLTAWSRHPDRLHDIVAFNRLAGRLREEEMEAVVDIAASWPEAANHLADWLRATWCNIILSDAHATRPVLAGFDGMAHQAVAERFRALDEQAFWRNRARTAHAHWRGRSGPRSGDAYYALRQALDARPLLSVRELFQRAGAALLATKPVVLASPLAVAACLPPEPGLFDLVVVDEADRLRPHHVLGILGRGAQIVVSGDGRQLPLSPTVDPALSGFPDTELPEQEAGKSLYGLFVDKGAPVYRLHRQYRSRHESLMAPSNRLFYESRLTLLPSPYREAKRRGLILHRKALPPDLTGVLVQAVLEHARLRHRRSLGVVVMTAEHEQAVVAALEHARRREPTSDAFFQAHPDEPFFVKRVDHVQGEVRDVILTVPGPARNAGDLPASLGPLAGPDGDRYLNVLLTRARYRCDFFIPAALERMVIAAPSTPGLAALRALLDFEAPPRTPPPGRLLPFDAILIRSLQALGFEVHRRATDTYDVDLAVVDPARPGRYVLGILTDGGRYHEIPTARERDRLRRQRLESQGWLVHQVWSADWFQNAGRAQANLIQFLKAAQIPLPTPPPAPEPDEALAAGAMPDTEGPNTEGSDPGGPNTEAPRPEEAPATSTMMESATAKPAAAERAAVAHPEAEKASSPEETKPVKGESVEATTSAPVAAVREAGADGGANAEGAGDPVPAAETVTTGTDTGARDEAFDPAPGTQDTRPPGIDLSAWEARHDEAPDERAGETTEALDRTPDGAPVEQPEETFEAVRDEADGEDGDGDPDVEGGEAAVTGADETVVGDREQAVRPMPYRYAALQPDLNGSPFHQVPFDTIAAWVAWVVRVESPVHISEVSRRMLEAANIRRASRRTQEALHAAYAHATQQGLVTIRRGFLWDPNMETPIPRDRSSMPGHARRLDLIAPEELEAAVFYIVDMETPLDREALGDAVCALFGFGRATDDMQQHIDDLIRELIASQRLYEHDGRLSTSLF